MALQEFDPFAGLSPLFPELLDQPVEPNPYDSIDCFDMLDLERVLEGRVLLEADLARHAGAVVPQGFSELDAWSLRQDPVTYSLALAVGELDDWQDSWDRRPSDRVCESSLGDTKCLAACRAITVTAVEIE